MTTKDLTCIACPMGCRIRAQSDASGEVTVENAACKRGITYGTQEFTCPMRMVTSSATVENGVRPLCAVKTRDAVPKEAIASVLEAIRHARPAAPIRIGQVIVANAAGTGVDVVATAACDSARE